MGRSINFCFNRYDCYGNEYVCIFKDGTYRVLLCEHIWGDGDEVFTGSLSQCYKFVEDELIAAQESKF